MGNSDILIGRYISIYGKNREIFKRNCSLCSDMKDVIKLAKKYFTEHTSVFNGVAKKLGLLIEIHEDEFSGLTSFREILDKVYYFSDDVEGKGLTATVCYNISTSIAYYYGIKVDMIYICTAKAQRGFKNFMIKDYDRYCMKYRRYHCFLKEDMPGGLDDLEEDEIAEFIGLNADLFKRYEWSLKVSS